MSVRKSAELAEVEAPATLVRSGFCDGGMATVIMTIECSFTRGFAGLQMIGNTAEVCRDGKERARTALEALGLHLPARRIVLSFTPADLRKDGNQFDLPVAVSLALLLREGDPQVRAADWLFAAELGLGGELRPVKGVVSLAIAALSQGLSGLVVAEENVSDLQVLMALNPHQSGDQSGGLRGLQVLGFSELRAVLDWLYGRKGTAVSGSAHTSNNWSAAAGGGPIQGSNSEEGPLSPGSPGWQSQPNEICNFDDMILTQQLQLAALCVAVGRHSLLLRGSPGTGKSMFAARLPSILPNLTPRTHVEALSIHSLVSERLPHALLAGRPPFRAPHHQASASAIIGSSDHPGELALAHGGVLFLDELPEFRRDLREALREPLETGEVRVARSKRKIVWKAAVILVAACNNCPCGWTGSSRRECLCGTGKVQAYQQRLSGPILDRIDLHVNVPETTGSSADLFLLLGASSGPNCGPSTVKSQTEHMRDSVTRARSFAQARHRKLGIQANAEIRSGDLLASSGLSTEAFTALVNAEIPKLATRRSIIRCLRVARTLADLGEGEEIEAAHLRQAWYWQAVSAARERGESL